MRDHLKSTIPQTQAAEAADAHMQDNYIQPDSREREHDLRRDPREHSPHRHGERHEPEPPPPNEKVEMASISNSTPTPFAGGEPIVMPIIEPVATSRRRVRRKEKEKR